MIILLVGRNKINIQQPKLPSQLVVSSSYPEVSSTCTGLFKPHIPWWIKIIPIQCGHWWFYQYLPTQPSSKGANWFLLTMQQKSIYPLVI